MTESSQHVEIEESGDERNVFVVDPEDYQQTKKLESIHDARAHVRKVRQENPGTATSRQWDAYHSQLATAVADYGSEILPLIERGLDNGVLEEEDMETRIVTVPEFVQSDGRIPDHENEKMRRAKTGECMVVYRQLDRILQKLGLGLEFGEDKGPAQI